MSTAPDFPAGPFSAADGYDATLRRQLTSEILAAPPKLRNAIAGLSDAQLDTKYKNWSIRQIVHHVTDSHLHAFIRFKWALTEDNPTIKGYDEAKFVLLADSAAGDPDPSLALLDCLHRKWVQLLECLTVDQFQRSFHHPEFDESYQLWHSLNYYPWHCRHHTGQVLWLRTQHGWA